MDNCVDDVTQCVYDEVSDYFSLKDGLIVRKDSFVTVEAELYWENDVIQIVVYYKNTLTDEEYSDYHDVDTVEEAVEVMKRFA